MEPIQIPHFEQYLGLWAMQESQFFSLYERIIGMDLRAHAENYQNRIMAGEKERAYSSVAEGVGIITISGTMTKFGSSFSEAGATTLLRREIRKLANDEKIKAIALKIYSPGGSVDGTAALADDVAAANKKKPVYAFIEDLGASAAYWVASQAAKIFANDTALVGSIGTYAVVHDYSSIAAREGVKVLVFRAGEFKGAGTPGTEITPSQQAEFQRTVDDLNNRFVRAVAYGRRMTLEQTRELADGRVHVGTAAQKLGLIDGVQSFDDTLNSLFKIPDSMAGKSNQKGVKTTMSETLEIKAAEGATPKAADYAELKAALHGADRDFIGQCLEKCMTTQQSTSAWMVEQQKRIDAANEEAKQAKAASQKPGVEALGSGKRDGDASPDSADPIEAWNDALSTELKKVDPQNTGNAGLKSKAISNLVRREPGLHQAYLETYNAQRKPEQRRRVA